MQSCQCTVYNCPNQNSQVSDQMFQILLSYERLQLLTRIPPERHTPCRFVAPECATHSRFEYFVSCQTRMDELQIFLESDHGKQKYDLSLVYMSPMLGLQ